MAKTRSRKRPPTTDRRPKTASRSPPKRFVGRDGSPVLDRYPPKDPSLLVRGPPTAPAAVRSPGPAAPPAPGAKLPMVPPVVPPGEHPKGLIALERPFNLDELSELLGETTIRIDVPREELAEALRRVSDFMGFGIYVYRFQVRPASEELLKRFVVELQRVDFSPEKHEWLPFEEKGRSDSPFGPSGGRR